MDGKSLPGVVFNVGPLVNGRVAGVGFSAFHAGLMEAFECGEEACSAGRAMGGVLLQWQRRERSHLS